MGKLGVIGHVLHNKQTSCLFAMTLYDSRESIISTYALVIEASKLNAYAKGHKWIGTVKRFNDIITKSLHKHGTEINNIKY